MSDHEYRKVFGGSHPHFQRYKLSLQERVIKAESINPDLLAALEAVEPQLAGLSGMSPTAEDLLGQVRAAIAKAKE